MASGPSPAPPCRAQGSTHAHVYPRLATGACQARHNQAGLGPTELCTGCSRFLLSSECEWGEYYRVAHRAGLIPKSCARGADVVPTVGICGNPPGDEFNHQEVSGKGKENNYTEATGIYLTTIKQNLGWQVFGLRRRFSRVLWAVWVGASWPLRDATLLAQYVQCDNTLQRRRAVCGGGQCVGQCVGGGQCVGQCVRGGQCPTHCPTHCPPPHTALPSHTAPHTVLPHTLPSPTHCPTHCPPTQTQIPYRGLVACRAYPCRPLPHSSGAARPPPFGRFDRQWMAAASQSLPTYRTQRVAELGAGPAPPGVGVLAIEDRPAPSRSSQSRPRVQTQAYPAAGPQAYQRQGGYRVPSQAYAYQPRYY